MSVESHAQLAEFLRGARAARDPRDAGLVPDNRPRRVPGLRRDEVAWLAGVSTDYYTRLEQGRRIVPSPAVLDALAVALGLDEAGRTYLHALTQSLTHRSQSRTQRRAVQRVRPGLRQLLDSLDSHPALILGRRTDVLAANTLARALFADFDAMPVRERNYARWIVLSDQAQELFVEWSQQARDAVESLRFATASAPDDEATQQLVGELSLASADFRRWWSDNRVHQRTHGSKTLQHPIVGRLTVAYETLSLPGDDEQTLFVYSTEPASPSRQALAVLASWTAQPVTPAQEL